MIRGKTIRRAILITLGAIVLLATLAFVVVHTSAFLGYARGKMIKLAQAKLGSRVDIQSISIPWDQLAVNVRGITIDGRGGPSRPPLLQLRRLKVGIAIGPLLSGHFKLSQVVLDQPVVRIIVNSQGKTNFPGGAAAGQSANTNSSSSVNVFFNLAIRHLKINHGTVDYNDSKIPLSADLRDVSAEVFFNLRSDEYHGSLGYKNGRITGQNYQTVANGAQLQFTAARSGITCHPLTITLPDSRVVLDATVQNYSHPRISGKYTAEISTVEVARVLGDSAVPAGDVSADGTYRYQSDRGQSFLDTVELNGNLSSSRLNLQLRQFAAPVTSVRATYSIENGNLHIASARGAALGGQLSINSGEISLSGNSPSRLSAALTNVSLRDLGQQLPSRMSARLSFAGRADVNARFSWLSDFRNLAIDARARISSPPESELAANQIGINGAIQAAYNPERNRASFSNSQLRIGSTTISLNGILSSRSDLSVTLSAPDLRQFSMLAAKIMEVASSPGSRPFEMPDLMGSARFAGQVHGSPREPDIVGQLAASNLQVESTKWRTIQANVALSPSRAAVSNGILVGQSQQRIHLTASVGLQHWSLAPSSSVSMHVVASGLPISCLQNLIHANYPVHGIVSADLSLTGTKQNPAGHGWIRIANATAWNQPVKLVTVNFHGNAAALHADLAAESPAGTISATLAYDSTSKRYQLSVNAPGVRLGDLEMVQARHLPLHGTLVLAGSGSGSIQDPQFSASIDFPQLAYRNESVSNVHSQLNLADHQLNFTARAPLYQGTLQAQGNVALTGQYQTNATLDVHSISVGLLAARFLRTSGAPPKGQADLHVEAHGPLKDPSQLTVRAEVPAISLAYQNVSVAIVKPLIAEYHDGVVALQRSEIKGTGVDLSFQGAVPVKSSQPFHISANGSVNLSLLQTMASGIQSSGEVQVDVTAQGTLARPDMQGNLHLQNASLSTLSLPVDLRSINGDIRVSGRRMELVNLSGKVNGGSMTAQGSVDLGNEPAFALAVAAKSVDINYPAGVRSRLDGDLRLSGSSSSSALTGRIVIDYLGFTQQMDIASLAGEFGSNGGGGTPSAFEKHMQLNVAIQSSSTLNVASSQLSVQGAANLTVVGTLADPVVLGRTTLSGGELFFLGKRYEIKGGTIQFANPTHTSPSVDLYATTTVNAYKISLHFLGPVDQMKTSFTSTPALPQADIINLLAFGQTTEQSAANPTPGGLGAESVLAQGVAGQISGKIQKLAGISQLSITPVIANANAQQNAGALVSIQQRVSGRLLVTFTTDTAQTQATAVQVQYDLGHGLSISALRDQNGGYGIDVHLHKAF
ncbi:MAG: translocation/assembly module TamB domain-containing protein [Candidatus Acidiferrales bacterium]